MKVPFLKSTIALSIAMLSFTVSAMSVGDVEIDGQKVTDVTQDKLASQSNTSLQITGQTSALVTDNESLEIRGQSLQFIGGSQDTLFIKNGGTVSIGGAETENIKIESNNAGKGFGGIFISNGPKTESGASLLNLKAKNITFESKEGVGIWAQNNTQSEQRPGKVSTVKIEAENTVINAKDGILAFSNSVVDISGNLTINALDHAIDTRGNSLVNINQNGKGTVNIVGDIVFETPNKEGGDSVNSGNLINSEVNINLTGENSSWTGRAFQSYPSKEDNVDLENNSDFYGDVTEFKLNITEGATWNMTGNSFVNDLTATDGSEINIQEKAVTLNIDQLAVTDSTINMQGGTEQTVTINDLTVENGTVNMAASTKDGRSVQTGHLTAKSVAEGGSVAINYTGITSDDIVDPDSAFDSAQANVKLEGTKQIQTFAEGDVLGEMTRETSANGDAGAVQIVENTKLASMKGVNAAALVAWRDEVAYTNQRLEFLRDASHAYGAWAQVYGGESTYDDASVDLKSTTVQVGADATLGDWVVGGAFSYMKGDADMTNGSADTDAYTLALYTTRQFDSGLYVNGMARYGRLSTDATAGNMTGSYDNNAFSVGGNVGYRFTFAQQAFVEPQFGLQYAYVTGDDYTATNGVKVEQDNFDALVASLGARIGFNFAEDAGKVFARASVNHDFLGEVDGTASNDKAIQNMYVDLGGTWVTYGVGTQFNFTDNLSVWGNVDRTTGGEVSTHYMMNAGLRYTF